MAEPRSDQAPAIRTAREDDLSSVAELHRRSLAATYPELGAGTETQPELTADRGTSDAGQRLAIWRERLIADGALLIADGDLGPVGFAWVGPSPDPDEQGGTGRIHSIHVDPDRVGQGIGRLLLAAARRWFVDHGFDRCSLLVAASNERAWRFYLRDGWLPDGHRRLETLALPGMPGPEVTVERLRIHLDGEGPNSATAVADEEAIRDV